MNEHGRTIALIDDDADSRLLASTILQQDGFRVIEDDGSSGVARRIAGAHPILILLDLYLDNRTGIDALHEIRAVVALHAIPVIAMTAALASDPLLNQVRAAFTAHIEKPIDACALRETMQRLAGRPHNAAAANGADTVAVLRDRFVTGLTQRLERIRNAATQQDGDALLMEVHRLRGAAGAFEFAELAVRAAHLEIAMREQHDFSAQLDVLLHTLESTIQEA
jgi:CheY-like chemotaxis protein